MDSVWFLTIALLAIGTLGAVISAPVASRKGYPRSGSQVLGCVVPLIGIIAALLRSREPVVQV